MNSTRIFQYTDFMSRRVLRPVQIERIRLFTCACILGNGAESNKRRKRGEGLQLYRHAQQQFTKQIF